MMLQQYLLSILNISTVEQTIRVQLLDKEGTITLKQITKITALQKNCTYFTKRVYLL